MYSLACHCFIFLPSRVFQPSCCVRSLIIDHLFSRNCDNYKMVAPRQSHETYNGSYSGKRKSFINTPADCVRPCCWSVASKSHSVNQSNLVSVGKEWWYLRKLYVWVLFRLLTQQCYGAYTASTGTCKFNSIHISQCPSGYGSPRFYRALDAYSVQSNVS